MKSGGYNVAAKIKQVKYDFSKYSDYIGSVNPRVLLSSKPLFLESSWSSKQHFVVNQITFGLIGWELQVKQKALVIFGENDQIISYKQTMVSISHRMSLYLFRP